MWAYRAPQVYPATMATTYHHPGAGYMNGGVPGTGGPHQYNNSFPAMPPANGSTGFSFKKRFDRLDWKKIAAADVDNVARTLDFNTLQENIMNITFCNIEGELDIRMIDPNFVKLFKLAQLTIEYLLHSQDYLSGVVVDLNQRLSKAVEEHEVTKKTLEKKDKDASELKKENHKRKKMLLAQQHILQAGANAYNKCPYCSKAFINATFLQSHLTRRHPEYVTQYNSMIASQLQQGQVTQQPGQVTQQPGQVTMVQQQAPPTQQIPVASGNTESLEREMNEIKERLRLTESQLVEERNARNSMIQQEKTDQARKALSKEREMALLREEQSEVHKEEIDKVRDMFMKELKEMNEKYSAREQELYKLQNKMSGKKSNLGHLKDEVQVEVELLRQQREEVAVLKEQLQDQSMNMDSMKKDMKKQEKKFQIEMKHMSRQHRHELEKLNDALEDTVSDLDKEKSGKGEMDSKVKEMQKMVQQSRETEQRLREKETHIEQMISQSAQPKREPSPQTIPKAPAAAAPAPAPAPAAAGVHGMYSDDEDDDEEEETTGFDPTSMGTLGTFGSLTLSGTKSLRLIDELKNNPTILNGLKVELRGILDKELERRGVSKIRGQFNPQVNATGVPLKVYQEKITLLKNERQQKMKRHKNFSEIRQQFINELEELAWRKYQTQGRALPSAPSSRGPSTSPARHRSPSPGQASTLPRANTPSRSPQQQRFSDPSHYREPPKPAPRANSPRQKMYMGAGGADVRESQATVTSSQWDSEDDEEEETDDDEETDDEETDEEEEETVDEPQGQGQGQVFGVKKPAHHDDDDDEDDDWDSVSELDAVDPSQFRGGAKSSTAPIPYTQPKGQNVAQLSRSIELQLSGRGGKKPAGGVNTVQGSAAQQNGNKKRHGSSGSYDDDDLPSVSSLDDETASQPPGKNSAISRKQPMRGSTQDTYSSNTYGTSAWGSSSKVKKKPSCDSVSLPGPPSQPRVAFASSVTICTPSSMTTLPEMSLAAASTVHPPGTQGSTAGRTSAGSITSWDDEDDLNLSDL